VTARLALVTFALVAPLVAGAALLPGRAQACSAGAERLEGWNAQADLALIARWVERDRLPPPSSGRGPDAWELRRLSTGEQVKLLECAAGGPPCDARTRDEAVRAAGGWHRPDRSPDARRLRVRATLREGRKEFALESRGARGWRRLTWLDFVDAPAGNRRYQVAASARAGDDVLVALSYHSRGGDCPRTVVQALRFPAVDLDDPANPGRHARLARQVRWDALMPHWRTVAELGPLPADRLLKVLEMAEGTGHQEWGARWWREAIAPLPPDQVAALTAAMRKTDGLTITRGLLGLDR
jgi:hypothetical protein